VAKAVRNNQAGPGKRSDSAQTGKRDGRSGKGGVPAKRGSRVNQARQRVQQRSGQKKGFSWAKFLRDVRVELSKVTWPTRGELVMSTLVVLVAVAIAGAYTGALDWVFGHLINLVIPK
jgi:preprotein translocase subunit SecE